MHPAWRARRTSRGRAVELAIGLLFLVAGVARGNPLDLARFGGLAGDPTYRDAFAIYWNPAALARSGWDVTVDGQLLSRQASYDRDATLNHVSDAERAANSGLATISTVGVVPGLAARIGRESPRLGWDFGAAIGAFVETGGAARWDKRLDAPSQYPGAVDGPQRWSSIGSSLIVVDLGLGLAARHRRSGLSIGVTPILDIVSFSTTRARNIDGTDDLVDSSGNLKEGRASFTGKGTALSCIFGARWDITPRWTLAATYQIGARLGLDGNLRVAFGTQAPATQASTLTLPIADTLRLGAAIPIGRWIVVRPMLQWARWSVLKEHAFTSSDGARLQSIPRQFDDGYLAQLRADAFVTPRIRLMAGIGGEKGPTPSRTIDPGFGEGNSFQAGVGAQVALTPLVDLSASFLFHYFPSLTVTDSVQQPLANGTYRDQREYVIVELIVHGSRNGWSE